MTSTLNYWGLPWLCDYVYPYLSIICIAQVEFQMLPAPRCDVSAISSCKTLFFWPTGARTAYKAESKDRMTKAIHFSHLNKPFNSKYSKHI